MTEMEKRYEKMIDHMKTEITYWQELIKNYRDEITVDLSLDSQRRLFNSITRLEKLKGRC